MNKILCSLAALAAAALVAGCADTEGTTYAGASVTRFHLGQPIGRGEISVEAADPADMASLEFAQYAGSIERELRRLGWTIAPGKGRSDQVAVVRVEQVTREVPRRSGFSIGIGGGTGSYGRRGGVGVGGGVTMPVGGRGLIEMVATRLSVRIQRRADASVAWEGRAETEARAGTPLAGKAAAVDRLAAALFAGFPGESGRTIRVR
jgi:hypothetical protein